jgi:protein SCO1/2
MNMVVKRKTYMALATLLGGLGLMNIGAGAQTNSSQVAAQALAQSATSPTKGVYYEQKVNHTIPLDLTFTDSRGQVVALRQFFDGKHPVILVTPFYRCKAGCTLELQGMADVFSKLKYKLGRDFTALTISINPLEPPQLAAQTKEGYLKMTSNQPYAAEGWHFMVGTQKNIQALAQATGFHYNYNLKYQQFVHPTGILVLTPQGRIYRYFFGTDYNPSDLKIALIKASQNQIGSPIDQIIAICCTWNPTTGHYGVVIQRVIVGAGTLTVLALAGVIGGLFYWEKKHPKLPPIAPKEGEPHNAGGAI